MIWFVVYVFLRLEGFEECEGGLVEVEGVFFVFCELGKIMSRDWFVIFSLFIYSIIINWVFFVG